MRRVLSTACEVTRTVDPDSGRARFTWVMSTDAPCKDALVVAQNWDFDAFRSNPVILADHERGVATVIGRGFNPRIDEQGRAVVDLEFMSDLDAETGQPENPLARQVEKGVEKGFIRAGSVGFMPGSIALRKHLPETSPYHATGDDGYAPVLGLDAPNVLHEFSICAIGADDNALRLRAAADDVPLSALIVDLLRNDPQVREAAREALAEPAHSDQPESLDAFVSRQAPESLDAFLKR